jgi:hypothetical protein
MRAISLSSEPLVISYALQQWVQSGELGVVSIGDKASVLLPLEKYEALVNVLRWLEQPVRHKAKPRARKKRRPTTAGQTATAAPVQAESQLSDLLSDLGV